MSLDELDQLDLSHFSDGSLPSEPGEFLVVLDNLSLQLEPAIPTTVPELPPFESMSTPTFVWGSSNSFSFSNSLNRAYDEAIHWKMDLFRVPYGKAGKAFVSELARLFRSFAEGTALESVALKACTLMPILLLQKPARKSKPKDHTMCLERRLCSWKEGDFEDLLREGRTIQQHISKVSPPYNE